MILAVLLVMSLAIGHVDSRGCALPVLEEAGYRKEGDIMIGGIVPIHWSWKDPDTSFTQVPGPVLCEQFSIRPYRWAQALAFAIDEINRDQSFLPNITFGFMIYDSCLSLAKSLRGTEWILTGKDDKPILNYRCQKLTLLAAVVADSGSSESIAIARLLGLQRYPQVSYFASSPLLSNKILFPSFFRTIPTDDIQARGLVQLVVHFRWTWVGLLSTENDYGEQGSQILKGELLRFGVCIAFHETIPLIPTTRKINHIVEVVKSTSIHTILVFSPDPYLYPVMEELSRQNISGKVWIASEGWSTSHSISSKELARMMSGTIGFAIHEGQMPGFREFLLKVHPFTSPNAILVKLFWEVAFGCQWLNPKANQTLASGNEYISKLWCTGAEKLDKLENQYFGDSNLRISYNIYNAVYSVAYALRDMHSCMPGEGPFTNNTCVEIQNFKPWQLLHYMKKVHFRNRIGEEMYFDSDGNPPAVYDIINWQQQPDGTIGYIKVGRFDSRASEGQELYINISAIRWNTQRTKTPTLNYTEVPRSVCSESCLPGYRKASQKGRPLCCYDCLPCAEDEISNVTDSNNCWKCASDHWPNEGRSKCVLRQIEILSFHEPLGATLTTVSICCSVFSLAILCIFVRYQDTPIARANNRELSFLLLGALVLSFQCTLFFIGVPGSMTCLLRQPVFGIIFIFCVSCVLAKTIMVIIAFNATKPNSNLRGLMGSRLPIVIVSVSTLIQVLICVTWLLLCPPFPEKNMKLKTGIIIWQCNECSDLAFWCMLGYMGLLACVSFLVAFLARKLPDSFNEAKWITFSMLVFLSVWLSFIPGYLSTQGKDTVALEIFGIISSSAGILICIFFPKCYIMLLRPDMNTREQLLGKGTRNNKAI
ncbi:extracellular calcium-sensing receptor-like [Rhinatrema bivittatum]|uniref:extracellular calcium-sensing receptor-like n=1 Tax=Rhinatrema bivittatum TaxID=194408 RepID=UPI00112675F9|nr:extracellular calcium-sensing receptor-like [Rhinatrema bivittatum]